MAALKDKLDFVLSEVRLLVLGTQIVLGFQLQAFFHEQYEELFQTQKLALLLGLVLAQVTVLLLAMPGARHRLVEQGKDSGGLHAFASRIIGLAMVPLMTALTLDLWIVAAQVIGNAAAAALAGVMAAGATLAWFALPLMARPARNGERRVEEGVDEETPLKSKISHLLTEARVVLPGAQALLGFQFTVMLTPAFERLPEASRLVHVGALAMMTLAVILLLTPSAWHRIAERGEETERFHRIGSRLMLAAMVPLALGICGDLYVVAAKVLDGPAWGIGLGLGMLALFAGGWLALPLAQRRR